MQSNDPGVSLATILHERFFYIMMNMNQMQNWAVLTHAEQDQGVRVVAALLAAMRPKDLPTFVPKVNRVYVYRCLVYCICYEYIIYPCTGSLVYLLSAYRKVRVSIFDISGCESTLPVYLTLRFIV